MIGKLNSQQFGVANQTNRNFAAVYTGGFGGLLNDMLAALQGGATGIQSAGGDIDSLALGGGAFSVDQDNTTGLTFALLGGRLRNAGTVLTVAPVQLALAAGMTNYVEVDGSGNVTSNTAGFTAGREPLYQVVTGASAIATTTSAKALLSFVAPGSVSGSLLTAAAATRSIEKGLGTSVTATTSVSVTSPVAGKLTAAVLVATSAVAISDASYWTFGLVNAGQAGTGAQAMLATTNTTKATGGAAIAANAARVLGLTALVSGTELNVAVNDCLEFTATATGTPPALSSLSLRLDFTFNN